MIQSEKVQQCNNGIVLMDISTYMQGHFIKPGVESQYVTFSLKRDGSAIGVVGEVLFPQAEHSIHVK